MCRVRTGIFLFAAILMLQAPLSASAGNVPDGTTQPDGTAEQSEEAIGEGLPGDALPGDVSPGDIFAPGDAAPEDIVLPGDLIPGDMEPPEDLIPGDMVPPEDIEPGDTTPLEDTEGQEAAGSAMLTIVCVACVAAAIVAVGIAVWAVLRKRGENGSRKPKATRKTGSGIPIQLEVYAGKCRNRTAFLELSDCLDIGSSPECDIVFEDPEVAPRHSRIRLNGTQAYIEDLGSPVGTALDGMRIQGQNRLQGGEVISLGSVEFGITFLQDA